MPDDNPAPQPPPVEELQFRKAEYETEPPQFACAACGRALPDQYFQLSGTPICENCAELWKSGQTKPPPGAVLRGTLFGFGAAIAGAAGMAIVAGITGLQFSLAAIAVGWLVAKAMRKGTNGVGSRRCQVIAVALTYFGICLSELPAIIKALDKPKTSQKGKSADSAMLAPTPETPTKPARPARPLTALSLFLGFGAMILLTLAIPFLSLMSGLNGLLGAVILFFGLSQAWRMMAPDPRELSGPHSAQPEPAAADA